MVFIGEIIYLIFCSGNYSKLTFIVLSRCNFNDIDVVTDIETTSFGNFAATQINMSEDNFYLLQNNTNNTRMTVTAAQPRIFRGRTGFLE